MPVIKSAKKKLRKDIKRTKENKKLSILLKSLLKKARKSPSEKTIREVFRIADKAAKKHIIHKNKAARLKSSISKALKNPKKESSPIKIKAKKKKAK
ncbi:MAG: 30S ribosomal protein S20 [Candidatus Levybacteria bacterium]|nr:30S ribosomal protein S20 [Candidatus Levybacteria bacterium]